MKKNLLFAMAAGTMLLATSCQNDLDVMGNVGEEALVSFNVTTPELVTRAFSDGSIATNLQYAVYDAEGDYLRDLDGTATFTENKAELNLQLTTGNEYTVLFWAANAEAPYTVNFAKKTMTVSYDNAVSNAEVRDAFYTKYTFTVTGAQTENVELYRPFAQLNIGTADLADSDKAGYKPTQTMVKVAAYETLNLWDGTVSGQAERTFDYADLPAGETFPVDGYEYLAMNYLLVGNDKEVVDVEFTYTDGADAKTRKVGSVPVQRNYRTNLYGDILTSEVDIIVEIVPDFNEPSNVAKELYLAAAFGGEVTLTEDVVLNKALLIQANLNLNLNGHTITSDRNIYVSGVASSLLTVTEGATLTLDGEGTVTTGQFTDYAIEVRNGNIVVNGGTYIGCVTSAYALKGNITINGGTFEATDSQYGAQYLLNIKDRNEASIVVKGGSFKGFDPANNTAENPAINFVAEGYTSKADGEYFIVTETPAFTEVANGDELNAAIAAGSRDIVATADITRSGALVLDNAGEINIDMDDYAFSTGTDFAINVLNDTQATIENGTFSNGFQIAYADSKLTFNGGTIVHDIASTSGRYCFYAIEGAEVVINDGEFSFANLSARRSYIYVASGATVYVKGGVFGKPSTHKDYKNVPFKVDGTGTVIVTGGTFGFDPSAWVADGYVATKNGSTWTVAPSI